MVYIGSTCVKLKAVIISILLLLLGHFVEFWYFSRNESSPLDFKYGLSLLFGDFCSNIFRDVRLIDHHSSSQPPEMSFQSEASVFILRRTVWCQRLFGWIPRPYRCSSLLVPVISFQQETLCHHQKLQFHPSQSQPDTQVYLSTKPSAQLPPQFLVNGLRNIKTWMSNLVEQQQQSSWLWLPRCCSGRLEIFSSMWTAAPSVHPQKFATWVSFCAPPSHSRHTSYQSPNLFSIAPKISPDSSNNSQTQRPETLGHGSALHPPHQPADRTGRTFSVAGPTLWNCLPAEICNDVSTNIHKKILKTHQFTKTYGLSKIFLFLCCLFCLPPFV